MTRWFFVLVLSLSGCSADVAPRTDGGAATAPLATIDLEVDSNGVLHQKGCLASCAAYPNPSECDALRIEIQADGEACGRCTKAGTVTDLGCGGSLFISCSPGASCMKCVDMYGNALVDSCAD